MSLRFLAYKSPSFPSSRVGIVSSSGLEVTPLLFPSGQPVHDLRELIRDWTSVNGGLLPGGPVEHLSDVQILAPLVGRDVLAVGKNYKAHAKEFQQSGFDSSDKKEQPDFPVIFTKRATSIVATGTEIYPHPDVTDTLDYDGELGIIIGAGGIGIKKEDAWKHVWGACVINDVTARERQRDHKQFYIGKSLDTFCPMGPYAVHASTIDWKNLILETRVNGETRQKQDTSELIFDIPTLIETCSMGITLQPGDVIATGTPAGVGIGKSPPVYLKSGDLVEVEITGLGVLSNVVGSTNAPPPVCTPLLAPATIPTSNPDSNLRALAGGRRLHVEAFGATGYKSCVIFVHGLGGSSTNWGPVIDISALKETHSVVTFDLEGHGLSPLSGEVVSVASYASSIASVLDSVGAARATIVAHSLGGLIATTFASVYPDRTEKLTLHPAALRPVKSFAPGGVAALIARASTVRSGGMSSVASAVAVAGMSSTSFSSPLVKNAVLASLLATPAEGYARACLAAATASDPGYSRIAAPVLLIAGEEDKTCPKATVDFLVKEIKGAKVEMLGQVGHWLQLEDADGVAKALKAFL